jgi:hypothetical protein
MNNENGTYYDFLLSKAGNGPMNVIILLGLTRPGVGCDVPHW